MLIVAPEPEMADAGVLELNTISPSPSRSAKFRYVIKKDNFYNFKTDIKNKFKDLIEIENFGDRL